MSESKFAPIAATSGFTQISRNFCGRLIKISETMYDKRQKQKGEIAL